MSSLPLGSSAGQWRPVLSWLPVPWTRAVVLGDVEVDRPGPQRVGHLLVGGPEFVRRCSPACSKRMLRRVVAQQVQIGVSQVGLKAERFGHVDRFQQIEHVLPRVHAGPADFAFGGEPFAVVVGDLGGFAERLGDLLRVRLADLRATWSTPNSAESMRMTPYLRTPCSLKIFGDAAGHFRRRCRNFSRAAASPIAESPTVPGQTGATSEPTAKAVAGDLVGNLSQFVVAGVGIGVRRNRK